MAEPTKPHVIVCSTSIVTPDRVFRVFLDPNGRLRELGF